jgi:hypothetical protein
MPWDASRTVPWRRLLREWALFAAILTLIFGFIAKAPASSYIGLAASFPLYLAFGAVLAKFGYERKTLAELRTARPPRPGSPAAQAAAEVPRVKPAPTKRTSTGPQRPSSKQRKR